MSGARSWAAVVAVLGSVAACGSSSSERACADAEARLGHRVCVHRVEDLPTWEAIGFAAAAVDQARTTTYMVPARSDARLPTVFVDAAAFAAPEQSLHFKFLTESFPEFQWLDYDSYLDLVLDPDRREWFAGSITEFIAADAASIFGFTIWDAGVEPAATITCAQFAEVYAIVAERVGIGDVAIVPANGLQRSTLAGCDLPVLLTVAGGEVVAIERVRGSTELPEGEWVLADAQLEELGASLATIAGVYPIDEEVAPTADVLLDTEWKLRADGRLAIKQVRPFLD